MRRYKGAGSAQVINGKYKFWQIVNISVYVATVVCGLAVGRAKANGVAPETSVVVVDEEDGEGVIRVKNTDSNPILLHTTIENIPEDSEKLVIATPALARVEGHQTQLVRFVLTRSESLVTEHMKRVIFEGIPQSSSKKNRMRISIRHNLPLIIKPKSSMECAEPWKELIWTIKNDGLIISNRGKRIVRLVNRIELMPAGMKVVLQKSYILPGERIAVSVRKIKDLPDASLVRFNPISLYGYEMGWHEAPIDVADSEH